MRIPRWQRHFFLLNGFILTGLGIAGAVLPLLPATPFFLLAAYCFARSSQRWHDWLLAHPTFGPYILAFRDKRGLTVTQKRRIALTLTLTLLFSFWLVPRWYARLLIGMIWLFWMVVLYRLRTASEIAAGETAD